MQYGFSFIIPLVCAMRPIKTITLSEILALLKKYLGIDITRATLYNYMKVKNFPPNTGLGRPRRWNADLVKKWIKQQLKNSRKG